ncbi:uncharacterized protein LOC134254195 [Saccostrea cucullata]|uniref:uncharacterized protein LOC134254195 n=1 Tax=Saccostrea cuccullata TaxID=36930 RepID=UPI002ED2B299
MEGSATLCLSLLCILIAKVYGSNGCPKSQNITTGAFYKNISWDTTWSDFQSKNCAWQLNLLAVPGTVNFTIRLDNLVLSSHDSYVYNVNGIVKTTVEDKLQVFVCDDRQQRFELPMSAIGRTYQFKGNTLCFFIPHGDYNYGQNIFTTHRLIMTIGVKSAKLTKETIVPDNPEISFAVSQKPEISSGKGASSLIVSSTIPLSTSAKTQADTQTMHHVPLTLPDNQSQPHLTDTSETSPAFYQQSTHSKFSTDRSTRSTFSTDQSTHAKFSTDHEIFTTKVSAHFTHNPAVHSSTRFKTITSPWALTIRTTETTVWFGFSTITDNPTFTSPTYGTTSGENNHSFEDENLLLEQSTHIYLLVGLVSGAGLILLIVMSVVICKVRGLHRDSDTDVYSVDYGQPWSWRKNWVIKRTFNEIEAEKMKADLQIKPSLPYRPSIKRHISLSRQNTDSSRYSYDEEDVYDNVVAMSTQEIINTLEKPETSSKQNSCVSTDNKNSFNNMKMYSKINKM